jgi:hypothetical protein
MLLARSSTTQSMRAARSPCASTALPKPAAAAAAQESLSSPSPLCSRSGPANSSCSSGSSSVVPCSLPGCSAVVVGCSSGQQWAGSAALVAVAGSVGRCACSRLYPAAARACMLP